MILFSLIDQILRREPCDRIKINDIMKHPWLQNIPKETYEPCSAKHRTYSKKNSKLSNDHEKICGYLKSLASIEEITEALLSLKFNFLTGKINQDLIPSVQRIFMVFVLFDRSDFNLYQSCLFFICRETASSTT